MTLESTHLTSGLKIPRVLTGLWQIADAERSGEKIPLTSSVDVMKSFTDAGLTAFDMADHYGSSEEIAGAFNEQHPKTATFFTKWVPKPGPITKDDTRAAIEHALHRMKCNKLDLLQYHAWNYADPRWLDGLFFLQELQSEGLIEHIGLTNFDTAHLRIAVCSGIQIASNQVCFSLIDIRAKKSMLDFCTENGIALLCYGTVAGGLLSEHWLGKPEPNADDLYTWSLLKYKRFIDHGGGWDAYQKILQTVAQVAGKHDVSIANVAGRYILDQKGVSAIIIGSRLGKTNYLDDTLRIFSFVLDDEDRTELDASLSAMTPTHGDCGDEYRKPPYLTASGDLSHHFEAMPPPFETKPGKDDRTWALSGTVWEDIGGFSRALRRGNRIWISGTTATHGQRAIGGDDPAAQAHFVIDKIEGALQSLGANLSDVVRTRVYVSRMDDWEAVARVHGQRFAGILPANTLIRANLVGDEYRVEMEAEAVVSDLDQ